MKKGNKKTLFIISIMVFFVFGVKEADANIVINEVQIAPVGERFVELYNTSGAEVDLTGYYLQRKTNTSDKYSSFVTSTKLAGKKIPANGLFLISKNSLDLESLTITESNSIQLKNSKQEIVYKIGLGDSDDCGNICVPNPGEGESVQRINENDWIEGEPTPGEPNQLSLEDDKTEDEERGIFVEKEEEVVLRSSVTTKIISPKIVFAGVPFVIDHETIGRKGEKIIFDRFVWNFGDGNFKELNPALPFEYVYFYPGDYALSLSYYKTSFSDIPEAVSRMNIKVIPSGIDIVSVGSVADPYIEIENNSNHEMVLNKWSIMGTYKTFNFPYGTTILPNKKIKLSPKITQFDFADLTSLTIMDNNGNIFAIYPKSKKISERKVNEKSVIVAKNGKDTKEEKEEIKTDENEEIIDLNNFQASAHNPKKDFGAEFIYLSLFAVVLIGVVAVIVVKKNKPEEAENGLSARDIKIIE